jgi:hypothetical protein
MNDNDKHLQKQMFAIEIIVFGIEIDDNDEHLRKQKLPIEVTVFELK